MSLLRSWPANAAPCRYQPVVCIETLRECEPKRESNLTSSGFLPWCLPISSREDTRPTGVTNHPRMPAPSSKCQRPAIAALRRGKSGKPHVKEPRPQSWPHANSGRPQGLADCKVSRRRENSMCDRKTVILRENKNSGGAKILFFEKSRFEMSFAAPKNRVPGAFTML